jgi:hypothetical protein
MSRSDCEQLWTRSEVLFEPEPKQEAGERARERTAAPFQLAGPSWASAALG